VLERKSGEQSSRRTNRKSPSGLNAGPSAHFRCRGKHALSHAHPQSPEPLFTPLRPPRWSRGEDTAAHQDELFCETAGSQSLHRKGTESYKSLGLSGVWLAHARVSELGCLCRRAHLWLGAL
jgi:hypothetical protein